MKNGSCHAEGSEARHGGLFLIEKKQKQIPRSARDDMPGRFSAAR
jgi:hypothetical protein